MDALLEKRGKVIQADFGKPFAEEVSLEDLLKQQKHVGMVN